MSSKLQLPSASLALSVKLSTAQHEAAHFMGVFPCTLNVDVKTNSKDELLVCSIPEYNCPGI